MKSIFYCLLAGLILSLMLVTGCSKERTEDEILASATKLYSEDDFDGAVEEYKTLIGTFPKGGKVPEALYAMGTIFLNKKKEYSKAESLFTILAFDFPDDPTASNAAYQRARILVVHLRKPDSAIVAYEYFLKKYPSAITAASARVELAELKKPAKTAK